MYVCICICMFACMYVFMYVYMYACPAADMPCHGLQVSRSTASVAVQVSGRDTASWGLGFAFRPVMMEAVVEVLSYQVQKITGHGSYS